MYCWKKTWTDSLLRRLPERTLDYGEGARAKELEDERCHHSKLVALLQRQSEVSTRLAELHDEGGDETERGEPEERGAPDLTGTQTARELIGMFGQVPAFGAGEATAAQSLEGGDDQAVLIAKRVRMTDGTSEASKRANRSSGMRGEAREWVERLASLRPDK